MKHIKNKKVLVVSDCHQDLNYANKCLFSCGDWDHVVFLGDWFDCFESDRAPIKETCQWINQKMVELGDKATWLIGNHDVAYLSSYVPAGYPNRENFYSCSGWTRKRAKEFNRYINPDWLKSLELCCQVEEFILSHAGFHASKFNPMKTAEENILSFYQMWENDKLNFMNSPHHWINDVGTHRGGYHRVGSPIWLDFNEEFEDIEGSPQIVGHTDSLHFRKKGASYCIDAHQTLCALIEDGEVCVHEIR